MERTACPTEGTIYRAQETPLQSAFRTLREGLSLATITGRHEFMVQISEYDDAAKVVGRAAVVSNFIGLEQ